MFIQLTREYRGQAAGERLEVGEAEGRTLIEQGAAVAVAGDALTDTVNRAFDGAVSRLGDALAGAVEKTLKEAAQAQSRSRRHAGPLLFGEGGDGDPRGKSFGDWLLCVRRHDQKALADRYGSVRVDWEEAVAQKAALNTATGTQGGYTVPAEYLPRLMQLASENAVVRPRATIVPMSSRSLHVPVLDHTTAPSAGNTATLGGLVARWSEEAASLTETEPTFKQLELVAHELSGYTKVSNTLLQDNAVGLEALLMTLFGRALGWYEDYAFLRGNGVGKPLGVLSATALISVTRSAASAFALADAAGMLARLLPGWGPAQTVWAVHPTVLPKLFTMVDTASGNVVFIDNARERPTMALFGIPIVVTEKLPGLNTLGDVLLLDLRHYVVGDRQQVEIAYSDHVAFLNNQGTWRFCSRIDGQPWLRDKVTLADASNTLSPFVGLAAG